MNAFFMIMNKYTLYKPLLQSSLHQWQSQSVRCRSAFTNRPKPIPNNKEIKTNKQQQKKKKKNKSPTRQLLKMQFQVSVPQMDKIVMRYFICKLHIIRQD